MRGCVNVAQGVFVATSRRMSTNSIILIGRGDALLIDPAWLPDELDGLARSIREQGLDVELIFYNGHAPGHTALWLPRQRLLIAGDMFSDVELPLPFYPDDLYAYMDALDRLSPFIDKAEHVIPGHGTVGHNPAARLDADRRYIEQMTRRGESDDLRLKNTGMAEAHAHMQRLLRESDVVD